MHSEFTVDTEKLALNLIRQAVNFDHVLGQELLKEKKRDGDWSFPPVLLPTTLFFFFFFFARGRGWKEREKTSLRNNSLTLTCSFFRAQRNRRFLLGACWHFLALRLHAVTSTFDTWVPCAWQRYLQTLSRDSRDSYVTAESTGFVSPWARRNQTILFIMEEPLSGSDGVLHQSSPKSRSGSTQYATYRRLKGLV